MGSQTISTTIAGIINFINWSLVPLVFALAFIFFLFGIYRGFIAGGANDKSRGEGRSFALWGVIGMAIMLSVWGLVNLVLNSFGGFGGSNMPCLPQFNAQPCSSGSYSTSGPGFFGNSNAGSGSFYNKGNSTGGGRQSGPGAAGPGNLSGVNVGGFLGGTGGGGTNGTGFGVKTITNGIARVFGGTGRGFGGYQCADGSSPNYAGLCGDGAPPVNASGQPQAGGLGASCTSNTGANGCEGNYVCNDATQTCAADSATTFSCADDSTPDANGNCANGQPPTNINGDQAPADGSVSIGGSCAGNEDACDTGTCNVNGVCEDPNNSATDGTGMFQSEASYGDPNAGTGLFTSEASYGDPNAGTGVFQSEASYPQNTGGNGGTGGLDYSEACYSGQC